MSLYKFKEIATVPPAKDFIDIVLSKTQRKTPTVVHPGYNITRIRKFYLRKIKYCQSSFSEKLQRILDEFPRIDDIHPFYADLGNVLYDRDHFKLALGQVNTVKNTIDNIAKEYVRMCKFADSLYKCKMLKRAAMGRMCTCLKKMTASLKYLEEVRQHLARLPTINPSTRSLIVTGYPNVGKSSFMNIVTNANVDVQPYAFTTKSIFVGHMDYQYCRWQVLDTPGILDHPLEERNSIEMTAITALAHINAAILFFIDISEQCGFPLKTQVDLFHSIKPLFKNKPILVVLNKIDTKKVEDLSEEELALIKTCTDGIEDCDAYPTSCHTKAGVDEVRKKACDLLLTRRVEQKVSQHKVDVMANRIHTTSVKIDENKRPPFIPESVRKEKEMKEAGEEIPKVETEKDLQEKYGGAGTHNEDLKKRFLLENEKWKYDMVPEILDGKNVIDFIDPDIMAKLEALEKEEELLLAAEGLMDTEQVLEKARKTQITMNDMHSRINIKRTENKVRAARTRMGQGGTKRRSVSKLSDTLLDMEDKGIDVDENTLRGRSKTRKRFRESSSSAAVRADKSIVSAKKHVLRFTGDRSRARSKSRLELGLAKEEDRVEGERKKRKQMRELSRQGKKGEADRWIPDMKPKHLYSGKRGNGKTDRR